jgi:hypothetical protein
MSEKTDDKRQSLGIIKELGELPVGAVISEQGLAQMFDRHKVSVKRAVDRGELPPSIRLFGEPVWTAGALLEHLCNRLEQAKAEAAKMQEKLNKLSI